MLHSEDGVEIRSWFFIFLSSFLVYVPLVSPKTCYTSQTNDHISDAYICRTHRFRGKPPNRRGSICCQVGLDPNMVSATVQEQNMTNDMKNVVENTAVSFETYFHPQVAYIGSADPEACGFDIIWRCLWHLEVEGLSGTGDGQASYRSGWWALLRQLGLQAFESS